MVYTEERLKHALEVFRQSKSYRERRGLSSNHLASHIESKIRQHRTRSGNVSLAYRATVGGTWKDKDESDDYIPGKKKRVAKSQKVAQKSAKRKRCDAGEQRNCKVSKRHKISYTSGRQNGMRLKVSIKFKSDAARARIAELFPMPVHDAEQSDNVHHVSHCGREDDDRYLLCPRSNDSSHPSHQFIAQPIKQCKAEFQFAGSRKSLNLHEPSHQHLPSACESDPIIINDSDDSADYRDILNGAQLRELAGQTRIIKTDWAHPMDYRCKPEVCNFCQDFRYPLFGCGVVNVEVIQLEPGVYEEMGGGHRERGIAPTKICLNCSLERITIAKCPGHEILPVAGYHEEEFDHPSFLSQITSSPYPEHPTCSVCIKPAFYACGATQKEDPFGLPVTGEDASGCGLLLCRDCAGVVANVGLDMEYLAGFCESSRILRADCELLLPGSDLWLAWRK